MTTWFTLFKFVVYLAVNPCKRLLNSDLLNYQMWSLLKSLNILSLAKIAIDSLTTPDNFTWSWSVFARSAFKIYPFFALTYWDLILLVLTHVVALLRALDTILALACEAPIHSELRHFLGFVKVYLLKLIRHALKQVLLKILEGALEAGILINSVLVHEERGSLGVYGIRILPSLVVHIILIRQHEAPVWWLL